MLCRVLCAASSSHILRHHRQLPCIEQLVVNSEGKFVWGLTSAPTIPLFEPAWDLLERIILQALINGTFLAQDSHCIMRCVCRLCLIHGRVPIVAVSYFGVGLRIDPIFNIFQFFGCEELAILLGIIDLCISNLLDHMRR